MMPVGEGIGVLKVRAEQYELHLVLHVTVDQTSNFTQHSTVSIKEH